MDIVIALPETATHISEDVCNRMGVIFPDYPCEVRSDAICLHNVPESEETYVRQTVLDQIIRSKHADRTAPLRELLYNRLLR